MSEVAQARIFIEGKKRPIYVQEDEQTILQRIDEVDSAMRRYPMVKLTPTDDTRPYFVNSRHITTVQPVEANVDISNVDFWGYGVKVRRPTLEEDSMFGLMLEHTGMLNQCAAVECEDMAAEIACIVHVPTGRIEYANPAEPTSSIQRYVRVVRLLAEAKAIFDVEITPENPPVDQQLIERIERFCGGETHALDSDHANAITVLANVENPESVDQAIRMTSSEFVRAYREWEKRPEAQS